MSVILVEGGKRLSGAVTVQGAKNSVLPILAATVLSGGVCCVKGCPDLSDVDTAAQIIRHLGGEVRREGADLVVDTRCISRCEIPEELMRRMRSSVMFLGAILGRCGEAVCSQPGGCELGPRPIDLHLHALRALGAEIHEEDGRLRCRGKALQGAEIFLHIPSVGATENAMLAACAAEGTTIISNAAREPEIVELQDFLRAMGACVQGAGSATGVVEGRKKLHGCVHRVRPDRIVAATYLCAAAASGGCIYLRRADYRQMAAVLCVLRQSGCDIRSDGCGIRIKSDGCLRAVPPVRTSPGLSHGRSGHYDGRAAAEQRVDGFCGKFVFRSLSSCAAAAEAGCPDPHRGANSHRHRNGKAPRRGGGGHRPAGRRGAGGGRSAGGGRHAGGADRTYRAGIRRHSGRSIRLGSLHTQGRITES